MRTIISLFLLLQCIVFSCNAQSLTEELGGIKTNFQIVSDDEDLKVTDQFIIQRAEKKANHSSSTDINYSSASGYSYGYGYGYGYGYQSFHLEFIAHESYITKEIDHKNRNYNKLILTFYGANDVILGTRSWDRSDVDILFHLPGDSKHYFYSIDLIDVPMVLLSETAKIDIIRKVSDKFK